MTERHGFRGYISSRPFFDERVPQHIQNLVIRDYCARKGLTYLLSATEYAMENCYMMLDTVIRELPRIEGVVLYSVFLLPQRRSRRLAVYDAIFDAGGSLHGAVENFAVRERSDAERLEDIWLVRQYLDAEARNA